MTEAIILTVAGVPVSVVTEDDLDREHRALNAVLATQASKRYGARFKRSVDPKLAGEPAKES